MTSMTGTDCAIISNLINTHTHTHTFSLNDSFSLRWEDQCEWYRVIMMTGLDCAVMCILINTQQHTHIPKVFFFKKNLARTIMCSPLEVRVYAGKTEWLG